MANFDPRLIQLFETLMAAGADWLVTELVEGIVAGVVMEESANDLALARLSARQDREPRRTADRTAVSTQTRPIKGDEQIVWAAKYVNDRLQSALALMDVSLDRMDRLVNDGRTQSPFVARPRVTLSLHDGAENQSFTVGDPPAAQLAVQDLSDALKRWVSQVTEGRETL